MKPRRIERITQQITLADWLAARLVWHVLRRTGLPRRAGRWWWKHWNNTEIKRKRLSERRSLQVGFVDFAIAKFRRFERRRAVNIWRDRHVPPNKCTVEYAVAASQRYAALGRTMIAINVGVIITLAGWLGNIYAIQPDSCTTRVFISRNEHGFAQVVGLAGLALIYSLSARAALPTRLHFRSWSNRRIRWPRRPAADIRALFDRRDEGAIQTELFVNAALMAVSVGVTVILLVSVYLAIKEDSPDKIAENWARAVHECRPKMPLSTEVI